MTEFLDGYLPYLLQRADQLLSARFHQRLAEEGVSTSEWRVLAVLSELGPVSVGVLTKSTLLPQPTTTHAVSRLERVGTITRPFAGRGLRVTIGSNEDNTRFIDAYDAVQRGLVTEDQTGSARVN